MILKNLFRPFFFQTQTLSSSSNSLMNFFILLPIVLINNVTLFKEGTAPFATVVYATFLSYKNMNLKLTLFLMLVIQYLL